MKGVQIPLIDTDTRETATARVDSAFLGIIGQAEAVQAIKRSLIVAISDTNPKGKGRVFLLVGPPSTGKTEVYRRIAAAMELPSVKLDGKARAVRNRKLLFSYVDRALESTRAADGLPLKARQTAMKDGMPVLSYPPCIIFIDEIHLASDDVQDGFLTALEGDERSVLIEGEDPHIADVRRITFVFATTDPARLRRAFRSRCTEIALSRYSKPEVIAMVRARFSDLSDTAIEVIAGCSRLLPRRAFDLAENVCEELAVAGAKTAEDEAACVRRVMNGRGIIGVDGETMNDLRYMAVIAKAGRSAAVGAAALIASLRDMERDEILRDIEPFLLDRGYITMTSKGRELTYAGRTFFDAKKSKLTGDSQ